MHPNDPLNTCSDEELLSRLRDGQRDVFGILVRRFQRELYGYLRRYTGDPNLADDVFQATFLQVYLKIGQYEPGRAARPWLYTIATHQAIDAMRRVGRKSMVSLDQTTRESSEGEVRALVDMLESREADPLERTELVEKRQLVRDGVDKLPDFLKQVVILVYFQGLRYRDVAEILDIPVGTVKSRLNSALLKLQENLSQGSQSLGLGS